MTVVIDGRTYTGDARAAFEAGEAHGKRVDGHDIAKTVCRRATGEERWKYGVELRITGSRWRPQTRAPHYPTPETYVYRPKVYPLTWAPYQLGNLTQHQKYEAWLAARDRAAAQPEVKTDEVHDTTGDDNLRSACQESRPRADKCGTEGRRSADYDRGHRGGSDSPPVEATTFANGASQVAALGECATMTAGPSNVTPMREPARAHVHAVETLADRKTQAAELLREIAGNYGPRRAHKLRAMADFLEGKAISSTPSGELPRAATS